MLSTKILVVDDEVLIRKFVKHALEQQGHEVVVGCSAEDGLLAFEQDIFDVILTDVKMVDMDGLEMLRQIRKRDKTVVTVVMTAMRDQQTAVSALECGAFDFLIKPFTLDELYEHVDHALTERNSIVENHQLIGDLMQTRTVLQRQLLEQDEKLVQTESYLNHLIDAAPFGIISTDREGIVLTFNDKAEQMYGYMSKEILGRSLTKVFGEIIDIGYATHQRKEGSEFPVLIHRQDIINDLAEEIAHLYVLEDQSEREMLQAQLFQAERLSMLGQMAPRIAHEFKTPLQLVLGNAELAQAWLEQDNIQSALDTLNRIFPAAQELIYMVQQMTNLGRPEKNRQESIDVVGTLEQLLDTLRPLGVIKYCKIKREYSSKGARIFGNQSQIEQAVRNLIVNAAQAMESSAKKELTIGVRKEGDKVCVTVTDTGHGIPKAKLEEIFEPFYSTKPEGKGTGLGLVIVRTMLKRYHADIYVDSEEGIGTTFRLEFPIYGADMPQPVIAQVNA
ncbi:MAG: response regulator [Candidatus Latescibacteria bacterium]|jgi:two-component system, cell cycle sensor histidine kinase and response regulator CckA|nr:response regulator [Candidatus Latescibacterota bacterium]